MVRRPALSLNWVFEPAKLVAASFRSTGGQSSLNDSKVNDVKASTLHSTSLQAYEAFCCIVSTYK